MASQSQNLNGSGESSPNAERNVPQSSKHNMKIMQIVKIAKIVKIVKVWKSVKSMKFVTNVAI